MKDELRDALRRIADVNANGAATFRCEGERGGESIELEYRMWAHAAGAKLVVRAEPIGAVGVPVFAAPDAESDGWVRGVCPVAIAAGAAPPRDPREVALDRETQIPFAAEVPCRFGEETARATVFGAFHAWVREWGVKEIVLELARLETTDARLEAALAAMGAPRAGSAFALAGELGVTAIVRGELVPAGLAMTLERLDFAPRARPRRAPRRRVVMRTRGGEDLAPRVARTRIEPPLEDGELAELIARSPDPDVAAHAVVLAGERARRDLLPIVRERVADAREDEGVRLAGLHALWRAGDASDVSLLRTLVADTALRDAALRAWAKLDPKTLLESAGDPHVESFLREHPSLRPAKSERTEIPAPTQLYAVAADGDFVVAGGLGCVLSLERGELRAVATLDGVVAAVAVCAARRRIVATNGAAIVVVDPGGAPRELELARGRAHPRPMLALSRDGRSLATAAHDVVVWDLASGARTPVQEGFARVAWDARDRLLVLTDERLAVWDGSLTTVLEGPFDARLLAVARDADAVALAREGEDAIEVWRDRSRVPCEVGGAGAILAIALDPSGERLAVGRFGGAASVTNATTGALESTFALDRRRIFGVAFGEGVHAGTLFSASIDERVLSAWPLAQRNT